MQRWRGDCAYGGGDEEGKGGREEKSGGQTKKGCERGRWCKYKGVGLRVGHRSLTCLRYSIFFLTISGPSASYWGDWCEWVWGHLQESDGGCRHPWSVVSATGGSWDPSAATGMGGGLAGGAPAAGQHRTGWYWAGLELPEGVAALNVP